MHLPSAVALLICTLSAPAVAFAPATFVGHRHHAKSMCGPADTSSRPLAMSPDGDDDTNDVILTNIAGGMKSLASVFTASTIFLLASTSPAVLPAPPALAATAAPTTTTTTKGKDAKVAPKAVKKEAAKPVDPLNSYKVAVSDAKKQLGAADAELTRVQKVAAEAGKDVVKQTDAVNKASKKVQQAKVSLLTNNDKLASSKALATKDPQNYGALKNVNTFSVKIAESKAELKIAQNELDSANKLLDKDGKQLSSAKAAVSSATKSQLSAADNVVSQEKNLAKGTKNLEKENKVKAVKKAKADKKAAAAKKKADAVAAKKAKEAKALAKKLAAQKAAAIKSKETEVKKLKAIEKQYAKQKDADAKADAKTAADIKSKLAELEKLKTK